MIRSFVYKGLREDHCSETKRKVIMLNVFLFIGFVLLMLMGIIALLQEAFLLSTADFVIASIFFILLVYLHRTGDEPTASLLGVGILLVFFFFLFWVGGVHLTAYMWLYSFPLFSLYLMGLRQGVWLVSILFCFCLGFLTIDLMTDVIDVYSKDFALRFLPSYLVVCVLAVLVEKSRSSARAELEEARNLLEERVAERTAELEGVNKQLRFEIEERKLSEQERFRLEAELIRAEKMESLGRLAGGVAHDLNNVLSGIVSYPDLLLLKLPPESEMSEPLKNIRRAGKRASAIVDDLLALARRGITQRKTVQINDVVRAHLQSPEYITLKKNNPGVVVETRLSDDLQRMSGSPVHLEKMIMNLLVNSFEAIEREGTILIATENRLLDSPINGHEKPAPGNYLVLEVKDSGVGISQENINRIFEPFYSSKVMGRSGSGLGMMVVWGTVTDHDGYLDVQSTPGKGTSIVVYFPTLENDHDAEQIFKPTPQNVISGNQETILLVDDVDEQCVLGKDILTSLGYQVETVCSGEAAISFIQTNSVDLVLLDMVMDPGIDGLDTYLRIQEVKPDQRVIIVSGYCDSERMQRAFELGVRGYVKKPYTLNEIARTVSRELTT